MSVNLAQYQQRLDWLDRIKPEDMAAEIKKSGFKCVRCGHCCTSLKVHANDNEINHAEQQWGNMSLNVDEESKQRVFHTNRLYLDAFEVERIMKATGMKWFDVVRPNPPRGINKNGELLSMLWLLRYEGTGEHLGDCYFYDIDAGECKIYEDRPLVCRSHPFLLDVKGDMVSVVLECPYGKKGEMSSEEATSYANATIEWYRIYLKIKYKFVVSNLDLDPGKTREEGRVKFQSKQKRGKVVFQVMDSRGVQKVIMQLNGKNGTTYRKIN